MKEFTGQTKMSQNAPDHLRQNSARRNSVQQGSTKTTTFWPSTTSIRSPRCISSSSPVDHSPRWRPRWTMNRSLGKMLALAGAGEGTGAHGRADSASWQSTPAGWEDRTCIICIYTFSATNPGAGVQSHARTLNVRPRNHVDRPVLKRRSQIGDSWDRFRLALVDSAGDRHAGLRHQKVATSAATWAARSRDSKDGMKGDAADKGDRSADQLPADHRRPKSRTKQKSS